MNKQLDRSWWLLRLTYGLVPIIAGADKFTNFLVDWNQYLSPLAGNLPISASTLMMIIGVIEIAAGAIVIKYTRIGAYIVSAWLVAIAFNLLTTGKYFDVAVRDLVMATGAFTLAKLSEVRAQLTAPGLTPRDRAVDAREGSVLLPAASRSAAPTASA